MKKKISLISAIMQRGYSQFESTGLILSGRVLVDDRVESRLAVLLKEGSRIRIKDKNKRGSYVSRAAFKLKAALLDFNISLNGRTVLDIGASHGGFSQVVLQEGACRLYAVDVAYGIFDYELRKHPSLILIERKNIKDIEASWFLKEDMMRFKEDAIFCTCDVSFISLVSVCRALANFFTQEKIKAEGLFLVKPQFEDSSATESGVLKDEVRRLQILEDVKTKLTQMNISILGSTQSVLTGADGNQETFLWLNFPFH